MRKKRSFYKTLFGYLACFVPLPNRLRVIVHKLAGVKFENPKSVFIGYGVLIEIWENSTTVTIGEHCIIAAGVRIYTHFLDGAAIPHTFYDGSVSIGDRVFIGSRAIIARPVIIGSGAVIAANSLVTRDVPSYSIVMGVPAQIVGKRQIKNGIDVKLKIPAEL